MINTAYNTFIFDLYGTLIDIRTDESDPRFWWQVASILAENAPLSTPESSIPEGKAPLHTSEASIPEGKASLRSPEALRAEYLRLCAAREQALATELSTAWPEIELADVFEELLGNPSSQHASAGGQVPEISSSQGPSAGQYSPAVRDCATRFRRASYKRIRLYPWVRTVLRTLRRQGCRLYLLSNAQRVFTEEELERFGLTGLFDAIYLSSDWRRRKPDPLFIGALMQKERPDPSRTLLVGNDFYSDIASAAAAGIDAVFLNTDRLSAQELARRQREVLGPVPSIRCTVIESGNFRELLSRQ